MSARSGESRGSITASGAFCRPCLTMKAIKERGKVLKSKALKYILHIVIVIGLIVAAAKYIHGEEVLEAIKSYDYSFAPALLALPAVYLSMKAWRFIYLMRPVNDLPGGVLFRGYVAG